MSTYGRFSVSKNGRIFVVEPISEYPERGADWGGPDLSNRPISGAIHPDDSIITPDNGFKNIVILGRGESPLSYIDKEINGE